MKKEIKFNEKYYEKYDLKNSDQIKLAKKYFEKQQIKTKQKLQKKILKKRNYRQ